MGRVHCVVLAGGRGTRIASLTATHAKSMVRIHHRPFIDYQITQLVAGGVDRLTLCVGYLGNQIRDFVGGGEKWGIPVEYVDEGDNLLGTAGALRMAVRSGLPEKFLVTYGDSFLPINCTSVLDTLEASGRPALMTVFRNKGRWDTSNVQCGKGEVLLYDKKNPTPKMEYIDYGMCAFNRAVISESTESDLADLFHRLSLGHQLAGMEVFQRFYEVGSSAGLHDFEAHISGTPDAEFTGR